MATVNTYLKQLKKRSLYEDIAKQILNLIIEGKYGEGDRLSGEREMAETLGVNRGTLREALRVMEFMRIIEKRVGEGIFVIADHKNLGLETVIFRFMSEDGLDAESLAGAHEAVVITEGVIAELAAQRITAEKLDGLKKLHRQLEEAVASGEHFTSLDKEFHLSLGRASNSPVLMSISSTMWVIVERYAIILYGLKENREKCIEDHLKIINALESGQHKQCRRLTSDHFQWARQTLFDIEEI
ncbi:MAG: FadR/GntR family transcriptional regulator [Desulfocucumaceae bacterium]